MEKGVRGSEIRFSTFTESHGLISLRPWPASRGLEVHIKLVQLILETMPYEEFAIPNPTEV